MDFELDRPNVTEKNAKLLWCPFAEIGPKMRTHGNFKNNYPEYVVIHFTAGRSLKGDKDSINCINYGIEQGYAYFCLSRIGTLYQTHSLGEYGWHAGKSEFRGLKGMSQRSIGIEINCAGRVTKNNGYYKTWFGEYLPEAEIRELKKAQDNSPAGFYHRYTIEQEKTLLDFLMWLKWNNTDFDFDNVVGHNEIAIPAGRKDDPGGSLSMSMPEYREFLKSHYKVMHP